MGKTRRDGAMWTEERGDGVRKAEVLHIEELLEQTLRLEYLACVGAMRPGLCQPS